MKMFAKGLRATIRDVRSTVLPDTGHMIMVERPNETIDILSAFLSEIR
jgi:pimeloyl-ACP methyl ester carboxylesterase